MLATPQVKTVANMRRTKRTLPKPEGTQSIVCAQPAASSAAQAGGAVFDSNPAAFPRLHPGSLQAGKSTPPLGIGCGVCLAGQRMAPNRATVPMSNSTLASNPCGRNGTHISISLVATRQPRYRYLLLRPGNRGHALVFATSDREMGCNWREGAARLRRNPDFEHAWCGSFAAGES